MSFSQHPELLINLKELKDAIGTGDINKLKEKINWFHKDPKRNKGLLLDLYEKENLCVSQTDLILAACHNNQAETLYYILYKTDILYHFPGTSFDDTKVKTQRTEAFKHALIWDAFPMVHMLYDYWSGDLHWIGHDIDKIKTLETLLKDAREVCVPENKHLQKEIDSLIYFNEFQQTLYSSISKITDDDDESTMTMLVEMLQIYDDYSQVRILHETEDQEWTLTADLQDNSDYMKVQVYIIYEFYFRKLDLNVALLILENLYVLRQYLGGYFEKNPGEICLYKDIENALYHFIYRTSEDWRLYLDPNRKMMEEYHNNNLIIQYDDEKLANGAVLFLERNYYRKCLDDLKNKFLKKHIISTNKKSLPDENYLAPSIMKDNNSLSKIVYYMKAIEDSKVDSVLMIERVLQVTGEMLKNTSESNHLLDSTKSLLQIAISVETVKCLHKIRNFLSHVDVGQLRTRIDQKITCKQSYLALFDDIKQDLKNLKVIIASVFGIIKSILDKSLLENGIRLLDERMKKNPEQHLPEPLLQQTDLTSLENIWIFRNKDNILLKIELTKEIISEKLVNMLPIYVRNIRQILETNTIEDCSDHWKAITQTLSFCYNNCDQLKPMPQINLDTVTNIIDELVTKYGSTSSSKNLAKQPSFVGIKNLGDFIDKHGKTKIEREKLISDLISRVYLLKKTLHPQPEENLRRYKHDREFRFVLEMLLFDIANVLKECNIYSLMYKSGKLLRKIKLRNVLGHGNPFLDIIGGVFDSYDLSNGLVSKAIMFADDGASIEALFKLFFQEKIDYDSIKEEKLGQMNDKQKELYKQFQKSENWEAYVNLLPKPRVN